MWLESSFINTSNLGYFFSSSRFVRFRGFLSAGIRADVVGVARFFFRWVLWRRRRRGAGIRFSFAVSVLSFFGIVRISFGTRVRIARRGVSRVASAGVFLSVRLICGVMRARISARSFSFAFSAVRFLRGILICCCIVGVIRARSFMRVRFAGRFLISRRFCVVMRVRIRARSYSRVFIVVRFFASFRR